MNARTVFRKIKRTLLLKRLVPKLPARVMYYPRTDEECIELYNEAEPGYEEDVLVKQAVVRANDIDVHGELDALEFPWHYHTKQDFIELNDRLQRVLPSISGLCDLRSVIRFKKKEKELYQAYFEIPIRILNYGTGSKKYTFLRDGRHRIWAAQQIDGLIPVWIIEYKEIVTMSLDEYKEHACIGEWKFY